MFTQCDTEPSPTPLWMVSIIRSHARRTVGALDNTRIGRHPSLCSPIWKSDSDTHNRATDVEPTQTDHQQHCSIRNGSRIQITHPPQRYNTDFFAIPSATGHTQPSRQPSLQSHRAFALLLSLAHPHKYINRSAARVPDLKITPHDNNAWQRRNIAIDAQ